MSHERESPCAKQKNSRISLINSSWPEFIYHLFLPRFKLHADHEVTDRGLHFAHKMRLLTLLFCSDDELQVVFREQIKFPVDACTFVLRINLDLTQTHDEALINIKKVKRTTHVQLS